MRIVFYFILFLCVIYEFYFFNFLYFTLFYFTILYWFCHTSTFLVFCILSKFWNLLVIFHTPWKISVRVFWLRLDLIYTEIWEWLTLTILVLSIHWHNFYCCLVTKLCPTVLRPMDCSLPGSFVHGIFQAITLEWVVISSPRGFSCSRDGTHNSCGSFIGGRLYCQAPGEALTKSITNHLFIEYSLMGLRSQVVHQCNQ